MKGRLKENIEIIIYSLIIMTGILLIVIWERSIMIIRDVLLVSVAGIIIGHIVSRMVIKKQFKVQPFLQLFSYIALFLIIAFYLNPYTATILISATGGIWLVIDGLIKIFYGVEHFRNRRLLSTGYIIFGLLTFFLATILLQFKEDAVFLFRLFLGGYLIIFGMFHCVDEILKRPTLTQRLNRMRLFEITPRTIFSLYSPRSFRLHYDECSVIEKKQFKEQYALQKDVQKQECIYIYVHMKMPVADMFGHVDFSIDGKNYTYGNYDESTLKWRNNKSEGVFIISPNDAYLKHNIKRYRKIIAQFTLNVTKEQKEQLLKAIDSLMMKNTYEWDPSTVTTKKTSYSKSIQKHMDAKFYKFSQRSKFYSYITATNNCVNFFEDLIDDAGIKMFPNQMLSVPGDIFNILNMYAEDEKDTMIIERKLLTKEDYEIK